MRPTKIVILTSSRFGIAADCLPELCDSPQLSVVGLVVAEGVPVQRWRKLRRKLNKMFRIGICGALNGIRMRRWYRGGLTRDVRDICVDRNVPFFEVSHINSEEMVRLLQSVQADLGLSLGNSYIAERVFSLPRYGMINVHGERLPDYQNAQSVIWPIYHNETTTGLSIHKIDRGIDTGAILYREVFDIRFAPRLEDTVRRTVALTRTRTSRAVRFTCENYTQLAREAIAQRAGRVFTTPSILQFARMVWNNRRLYRTHMEQNAPGVQ